MISVALSIWQSVLSGVGGVATPATGALLLEDGVSYMLAEDGFKLLLE